MAVAYRGNGSAALEQASLTNTRKNTILIVPAYNEERFIGSVVIKARRHVDIVIVVDDGSTDATADIAAEAGALVERLGTNQGKGVALNHGFRKALSLGADVVVTIDADGQHLPDEIPLIAQPAQRGEADIVVGSRYMDERSDVPGHRVFGHRLFNLLNRGVSGISLTDSQSGFRAFSARALRAMNLHSHGFSVESEMQFLAREQKLKMVEVPIVIQYLDRPKRSVVQHGLMVLNGTLQLVGQYRPLLFMGVPGVLMLLIGLFWGANVVDIYTRTHTLAVGYALISVLLATLGTVSVSTGIILHSVRGLLIDLIRPARDR